MSVVIPGQLHANCVARAPVAPAALVEETIKLQDNLFTVFTETTVLPHQQAAVMAS